MKNQKILLILGSIILLVVGFNFGRGLACYVLDAIKGKNKNL